MWHFSVFSWVKDQASQTGTTLLRASGLSIHTLGRLTNNAALILPPEADQPRSETFTQRMTLPSHWSYIVQKQVMGGQSGRWPPTIIKVILKFMTDFIEMILFWFDFNDCKIKKKVTQCFYNDFIIIQWKTDSFDADSCKRLREIDGTFPSVLQQDSADILRATSLNLTVRKVDKRCYNSLATTVTSINSLIM